MANEIRLSKTILKEFKPVIIRDSSVIRDRSLVIEYLEIVKFIGETDIDNTYESPKLAVTYCKLRKLAEEQRADVRQRINSLNTSGYMYCKCSTWKV